MLDEATLALIDIDQAVIVTAITSQKDALSLEEAELQFKLSVTHRIQEVREICPNVRNIHLFISGKNNFRKRLRAELVYKGNRPEKPEIFPYIYELAKQRGAYFDQFLEADDLTAMRHSHSHVTKTYTTVLVDQDKDLNQIAGWRIVPSRSRNKVCVTQATLTFITEEMANYSLYRQLLTGDSTDNIAGLKSVGNERADKLLEGCITESQLWERVVDVYFEHKSNKDIAKHIIISRLISRASLLYMKRGRELNFIPPLE